MDNNKYIFLDSVGENLTSFKFYSLLLNQIHQYYHSKEYSKSPPIITFTGRLYIDSTVIPLLAGLGYYLKKFHSKEIELLLTNTPETINLINFLDKSDFFYIVGANINPVFPIGKKIFSFEESYIGGYTGYIKKQIRNDHKLRCYSQDDGNIKTILGSSYPSDIKRDYLLEYFKGRIENDFENIFEDKELLFQLKSEYSSIIAELTVNGIFHSGSHVFVMAQSKGFSQTNINTTIISVVDIGIGFYNSLMSKNENDYLHFKKFEIIEYLKGINPNYFNNDFNSIFEVLW